MRVVMDSRLSHDPRSRLGRTAENSAVWMLHLPDAPLVARKAWADQGAVLIEVAGDELGKIDVTSALQALASKGITRILCEGGGRLAASLLKAGLVDDLSLDIRPGLERDHRKHGRTQKLHLN